MAETPNNGENNADQSLGSEGTNDQLQPDTVAKSEHDAVLTELETLRKEKQQVEMEKNLQRNKAEKEEREKAEAAHDYESLFKMMKKDLDDTKAALDQTMTKTEASKAREEALASLPDTLQAVAKELLGKASTPEQIKEKVEELNIVAKSLGVDTFPKTETLNPNPKTVQVEPNEKSLDAQADDLHRRIMAQK